MFFIAFLTFCSRLTDNSLIDSSSFDLVGCQSLRSVQSRQIKQKRIDYEQSTTVLQKVADVDTISAA